MRPVLIIPTVVTAGILASCQTPSSPSSAFSGGETAAVRIPAGSPRPQAYAIPGSADSDDLVASALSHHPSLAVTRARITALEQSAIQARALPDPSASVTAGSMAETAAGQVMGTVGVQQKIPYPGKRGARAAVALRQADAMRAQLGADELALAERVRAAYWDYYVAHRTIGIVTEGKEPLIALRKSVEARVATNPP